jgi:hypothetical protein
MRKIGVLILAAVLTSGTASAAVAVKMTGGLTYLFGNDINSGVRGSYDFLSANYENVTGSLRSFLLGWSGGAEIIVPFGEGFGLGVGAGIFRIAASDKFAYTWWTYAGTESFEPKLTVIPMTVNLHYQVPVSHALDLDVFGGTGFYLTRFEHKSISTSDFFSYEMEKTFTASKGVFGLQGGIALEIKVSSSFAFVLQAEARLAKAMDLQGDWTEQERTLNGSRRADGHDGLFWYYEKSDASGTYPQVSFAPTPPSDTSVTNSRKGTLDLTGLSAAAGIKITF